MKSLALAALAVATVTLGVQQADAASYVYAGSWDVGSGPSWTTQPLAYSGRQAAALLFGGNASDYVTSTVSDQASDIDFQALYSVLGLAGTHAFADDYLSSASSQASGYYYSGDNFRSQDITESASAFVNDNASGTNYAFRIVEDAVPEPASWALMVSGFGIVGGALRRKAAKVTFA